MHRPFHQRSPRRVDAGKQAKLRLLRRHLSRNFCALTFPESFQVLVPNRACFVEAVSSRCFDRALISRFRSLIYLLAPWQLCLFLYTNRRLVDDLYLHRTYEPRGYQPGRIFCRTGAKCPRFAQDQAVEERICYRDLQDVLSRLNQVCDVRLVRAQQQSSSGLAIDRNLSDISYISEIEAEPAAGIRT